MMDPYGGDKVTDNASAPVTDGGVHERAGASAGGRVHLTGRDVRALMWCGEMYGIRADLLAALLDASKSGKGQVVDAAMCVGAASLMSMFFDMTAMGRWTEGRDQNFLDGGAHFYGVYECACGNFVSIGSIEPQFYALLRQHAGLTDADFDAQMDRKAWAQLRGRLTQIFKTKTRGMRAVLKT